jgi:hypothetical protein
MMLYYSQLMAGFKRPFSSILSNLGPNQLHVVIIVVLLQKVHTLLRYLLLF